MKISICELIDQLIAFTPAQHGLLLAGLQSMRQSALYTPPECWWEVQNDVAQLLVLRLPRGADVPDWARQMTQLLETAEVAA